MARLIKTLFVLVVGSWLSFATFKQAAAQQLVALPDEAIRIADFGLENRVPSAIDLVGPEDGPAGRKRAVLVRRMQCWIDGAENCPVAADVNDPRVRAIRRFIGLGSPDRDAAVVVHFPDQSRIELRLERLSDLDPNDWDQRVYRLIVLTETAREPASAAGSSAVPMLAR